LVVSVVCYIATFSFSGLLFHWFTPSGQDCGLNLFFVVFTLMLVFLFAIVALHPKVFSLVASFAFAFIHLPIYTIWFLQDCPWLDHENFILDAS
jgi:hypothetical protein